MVLALLRYGPVLKHYTVMLCWLHGVFQKMLSGPFWASGMFSASMAITVISIQLTSALVLQQQMLLLP